jgi:hypothetical protein
MRFISSKLPTALQWLKTFQVAEPSTLDGNGFRKAAKVRVRADTRPRPRGFHFTTPWARPARVR